MRSSLHHSVLPKSQLRTVERKLLKYTEVLATIGDLKDPYRRPESSLYVSGDARYQLEVQKGLKHFKNIEHVILIGIGGSSLGTEAVYHALKTQRSPAFFVIDEIHAESLEELRLLVKRWKDAERIAMVVVSKSGTTTETMLNAVKAIEICEERFGDGFHKQLIFIGDKDTTFLDIGRRRGAHCIAIPGSIGGRYSVFTAVGMVPLTLLGIDVLSLRKGARDALHAKDLSQVRDSAGTLALHAALGMRVVNFFTFNKRLKHLGYWYRQLLAESIGKSVTVKGTAFSHQLLPIVSSSTDLHSMAQLFLAGYEDIYTHFVYFKHTSALRLLTSHWLLEHVPFLKGRRIDSVSSAIIDGVLRAYDEEKLPYRQTEISECSAHEIGYLMNSLMAEVMCVAHALDVNAFDQPNVESYKKHTRAILNTH